MPVYQKMLTHQRRDLLVLFRASFFCPNVGFCSMSSALWKGPDCEKLKSTCDNLGQWFLAGEEFLPMEEFHEFREGIFTF